MKILLDENVYGLEKLLRHQKWEITTVQKEMEKGTLKNHEDGDIVQFAKDNSMIVITKNYDMKQEADTIHAECIWIDDVMLARAVVTAIQEKYP
ncbi:MAG: DUF5615 family PIN-like protein [Candidatus Methanomethylicaceae archaeon]|jgi:predicted nuclease of predicted toxin-antitoxin system